MGRMEARQADVQFDDDVGETCDMRIDGARAREVERDPLQHSAIAKALAGLDAGRWLLTLVVSVTQH